MNGTTSAVSLKVSPSFATRPRSTASHVVSYPSVDPKVLTQFVSSVNEDSPSSGW